MTDLGTLGGSTSGAAAINEHGEVVGESISRSGYRGFVWRHGVMTELDSLGRETGQASSVNDHGLAAGLVSTFPDGFRATVWPTRRTGSSRSVSYRR
jgi:probable HAF family extracellular repeat protein